MVTVEYDHEFPYTHDDYGKLFPRLTLQLSNPSNEEQAVDLDAYLDSGAEMSLFDGSLSEILGLDLLSGEEWSFVSTAGRALTARLHRIRIVHPVLGTFDLNVGFSTAGISRNLLGRDFFARIQIGFREHQSVVYMTAQP